jgi:hypothetical protein
LAEPSKPRNVFVPLKHWDHGFESHSKHGCARMSAFSVLMLSSVDGGYLRLADPPSKESYQESVRFILSGNWLEGFIRQTRRRTKKKTLFAATVQLTPFSLPRPFCNTVTNVDRPRYVDNNIPLTVISLTVGTNHRHRGVSLPAYHEHCSHSQVR